MNEILARAHVLVNTSLYEGFANTFIQAWLRGVPVVSLHVDPDGVMAREDIGVRAGSEERLMQAVRTYVTDALQRDLCGHRAQRYATRHHSLENAQALAQLIETGTISPAAPIARLRDDSRCDELSVTRSDR